MPTILQPPSIRAVFSGRVIIGGNALVNDESDAGSRYHQIYEKYGASGNAGMKNELTEKYNMDVEIRCLLQQDEPSVELVVHKGTVRDLSMGLNP